MTPKCRGYTKEGKWVYGWYAKVIGYHYIIPDDADIAGISPPNLYGIINSIEVLPETVGMFTDLRDKNGKEELYAHDLLKDKRGNIWEVVWMDKEAGWGVNSHSDTGAHAEMYPRNLTYALIIMDGLVKVGDIHTTPDLLEEKQ